jgi:5-methylcytosine-specific restriction endonuclease McrA
MTGVASIVTAMVKLCIICSGPLPYHHSKYCSEACEAVAISAKKRAAGKAEHEARGRTCLNCDAPVSRGKSKYCSRKCWSVHYRKVRKEHLAERRRAHYPDEPGAVARRQRREDVRREFPECLYCGKSMEGKAPHARYCNKRCTTGAWRRDNPELAAAQMKRFKAENPEYFKVQRNNRRIPGDKKIFLRDWLRLVNRFGGACAYCGCTGQPLEMDHVVPVSRGGQNTIGNILPACLPCNRSKWAHTLVEWRRVLRREGREPTF